MLSILLFYLPVALALVQFRNKPAGSTTLPPCGVTPLELTTMFKSDNQCAAILAITPCVMFDTAASDIRSRADVTQVTIASLNDGSSSNAAGVKLAADRINALNAGKGFPVGYVKTSYVHLRVVSIITGLGGCELDAGGTDQYAGHHTNLTQWVLGESAYEVDFLVGTDSSWAQHEVAPANQSQVMLLAQVGPRSFYEEVSNMPYVFGMHLDSSGYSYGSLKQANFNGAQTYAVAGRRNSAFFQTTCEHAHEFAASLGMTNLTERVVYEDEEQVNEEYQTALATSLCDSGADVIIGCINHDEARVWDAAWKSMKCRPRAVWLTCVAWGCLSDANQYMLTGTQWSRELSYGDEFFTSGDDISDALTATYGAQTVSSNTIGAYTSVYVYYKLFQRAFRDVDIPDITALLNHTTIRSAGTYELLRRQLETLVLPDSVFGPVQMGAARRNEGRHPVSIQALPTDDGFALETFAPGEAASTTLNYPAPVSLACVETAYLAWAEDVQCWLCDKCDTCPIGFEPDAARAACVVMGPSFASMDEQRIFWTCGFLLVVLGSTASVLLAYQYLRNPALQSQLQRSYLAISIPDFINCLVFMPFFMANLLRGVATPPYACQPIAVLTYGAFCATFCGPPVVAFITWRKLVHIKNNKLRQDAVSGRMMFALLVAPWLLGFGVAAAVNSQGLLGSYRGLYCYATDWTHPLTGGLTIGCLLCACLTTGVFYYKTYRIVDATMMKDDRSSWKVVQKGRRLVLNLLLTWSTWAIAGLCALCGAPIPIWVETLGGLLIFLQPIIDAYTILSMPAVRLGMLPRMVKFVAPIAQQSKGAHLVPSKNECAHVVPLKN